MSKQDMIVQRVHDTYNGRNTTVGVFVGVVDQETGHIRTGWSRILHGSGDKFNMDKGIRFAFDNMMKDAPTPIMVNKERQDAFYHEYEVFRDRCRRYFQGFPMKGDVIPLETSQMDSYEKDIFQQLIGNGFDSEFAI